MGKHIGLIGGIGPAATVVYYQTLVRLHAAAGEPLALTIAHADLGTLIANLEAARAEAQAAVFARHVELLRRDVDGRAFLPPGTRPPVGAAGD